MIKQYLGINWLTPSFFLKGWTFFLKEELYSIAILLTAVLGASLILPIFHYVSVWVVLVVIVLFRKIMAGGICTSNKRLDGKIIIITGSNTGIGKETARDLSRRGAEVILACRDMKKAEKAVTEIRMETANLVTAIQLDLASLSSVRSFAAEITSKYSKIDGLINNAGIMMCPYLKTEDNFEMQMGVNHFGHFLLTNLLLPLLKKSRSARIINVTSLLHWSATKIPFDDFSYSKGYNKYIAYGNSKLANVLFTRQLAKKLKGTNIQVFSLHPGVVQTELGRHMGFMMDVFYKHAIGIFQKSVKEGAQTSIYCATEAVQYPRVHFSDCAESMPSPTALDDALAEKLWRVSEEIVGLESQ